MTPEKIQLLAETPRPVTPELIRLVGNPSRLYELGCYGVVLAALALVASGVASFFTAYALFGAVASVALLAVALALVAIGRVTGRGAGERLAAEAPLILVGVVQANESLFVPEGNYAGAVLIYATEPSRALDAAWVQRCIEALLRAKNEGHAEHAIRAVVQDLWNERSLPDAVLPPAICEGAAARIYATAIDAAKLPGERIPDDRLIPALLVDGHPILLPGSLWA